MASLLQRACQPQRLLHSGPRALPKVAPVLRPHQPCSARWARSPGSAGTAPPAAGRGALAVRAMAGAAAGSDFPSLVSPEWLRDRLGQVKVLDATWYMPNAGKDAVAEFKAERIPGAQFFDLDGVCDKSTGLPHMLPSEQQFAAAADALGISNNDAVVVYDNSGIFSAPRAWWTWKVLGHSKVAVLDGGLPAWKAIGGPLDTAPVDDSALQAPARAAQAPPAATRYRASLARDEVRTWRDMLANIESKAEQVMDARPAARWRGEAPEPRPGLPSGHIPGSKSVPFADMLEGGRFKPPEQLRAVLEGAGIDPSRPLVASCGSGTTACIILLAAQLAQPGRKVAVYDGSWTEWAQLQGVPIGAAAAGGSS